MTIESDLNDQLKTAMKAKEMDKVKAIRQLKSKVQEASNQPNFTGDVDDALYVRVIKSYVGSLKKGIAELAQGGERTVALREQYQWEIDLFGQWLPTLLDEAATRELVKKALEETGVNDVKMSGKVMGHLMKSHKDQLDPGLAKTLIAEALEG
ncbi:MAG: GatB/YqeY domain-containing protein [Myxococcota bacterium]